MLRMTAALLKLVIQLPQEFFEGFCVCLDVLILVKLCYMPHIYLLTERALQNLGSVSTLHSKFNQKLFGNGNNFSLESVMNT